MGWPVQWLGQRGDLEGLPTPWWCYVQGAWVVPALAPEKVRVKVVHSSLFASPRTVAHQGPPMSTEFSNKSAGVGIPSQGIFPTQESNPGLPYCRRTLYHLSHQKWQYDFWSFCILSVICPNCACILFLVP